MPETLGALLDRLRGDRRVLIAGVGLAVAVAIVLLARVATAPAWVPLMPGLPMESIAEVTPQLDEAKIAYRLEAGGAQLRVPETELPRARVLLAQRGIPSRGRPGFELFDEPAWGMTDFTQKINFRRAMEGELERTLTSMRGVQSAQVHLALQEQTGLKRSDRPSEASVVLSLAPGARPGPELADGVAYLVASSVDGLQSKNVTVLDDTGRLLSASEEAGGGSLSGASKHQLALQREVEGYLEEKAESLVAEVVGAGNVRVQVSATLDFDRIERTTQSIDANQPAVTTEQRSEITPGPETPGAAQVTSNATYAHNREVETVSSGIGGVRRLTVAVLLNDAALDAGGAAAPRSPDELARVEALVRNAVGVDSARGDAVSVVSIPFRAPPPVPADEPGPVEMVQIYHRPVLTLVALVLAFVFATRVLAALRRPAAALPARARAVAEARPAAVAPAPAPAQVAAPAEPALARIASGAASPVPEFEQPELAARVIRAWMQDA